MTLCTMRIELNTSTYALSKLVAERERGGGGLGERISFLPRCLEIAGVMKRNGTRNINSVNNNTIVHVV